MHILLTRPLDDCKELILRFKSLGHKVSHLPVINVYSILYDEPKYNDFKGIIFAVPSTLSIVCRLDGVVGFNCFKAIDF